MKKFIGALLSVCIMLAGFSVAVPQKSAAAVPELSTMPAEQEIITILGVLGIMNGDSYGELHLDNFVTRAEFTKMALCASSYKKTVNNTSSVSPFSDVPGSHWASGYIVTAVKNNFLRGYIDGSFKPDNTVTLEEAVTVMLRILGYSELDSGKYPDTQLAKYSEMKLDNMISAKRGQALTRRECMYLIYNCLCAEQSSGTVHCQALGYATDSDGRIDYIKLIGDSMDGPVTVYEDNGYEKIVNIDLSRAVVYRDGIKATVNDIQLYDQVYYNRDIKTLWCFSDKKIGTVKSITVAGVTVSSSDYDGGKTSSSSSFGTDTSASVNANSGTSAQQDRVVVDGTSYKLSNAGVTKKFSTYGEFRPDDFVMLMLDKDGNVADAVFADSAILEKYLDKNDDRVALINSTLKGPYVAKDSAELDKTLPFAADTANIYHGSKKVSKSYLAANDVYYYSVPFNSVWIYRDTATGFVKSVAPSPENPTSVVIGSKTYTLEGADVKQQFSNFGTFGVDDFVTVLLGSTGTAVYATEGDIYSYANGNDDDVSYAELVAQSMEGPYIVKPGRSWQENIPFDVSQAVFYRKNSIVNSQAVKDYDVLYYSKALKTIWVYSDKATGTLEGVAPNRISPSSVTVSGKTYTIESTGAAFSLSSMGTYSFGDTVTLILGKDGGVVDVIAGSDNAKTRYGFITALGEGTYTRPNGTTYSAENITILGTDTHSYTYEYDHSVFAKGDFVSVSYVDGKVKINKITKGVGSADIQTVNGLISNGGISDDAVILDVRVTSDADSVENKSVTYKTLYSARLYGAKLNAQDIYHVKMQDGKISELILNDFTGDLDTYGILKVTTKAAGNSYSLVANGAENNIVINTGYGEPDMGAAKFTLVGGKYIVKNLTGVAVDKNGFERGYCKSLGKTYNYASDVEYYIKESVKEFTCSTYDDIAGGDYKITAYYDDTQEKGGRIRVIIAE